MNNSYVVSERKTCPVFGFETIKCKEWFFYDEESGYSLDASLIDKSILHVVLKGNINFDIYNKQQAFINKILDSILEKDEKIILLHDYKDLHIKSMKARMDYAQWILKHKHQISKLLFYNLSHLNEIYIKAGMLFNPALKAVLLFKDYNEAINYIIDGRKRIKFSSINIDDKEWENLKYNEQIAGAKFKYVTQENWLYKNNHFSCSHRIYDNNIIYREINGTIGIEEIKATTQILDEIFSKYFKEDNKASLVINLKRSEKISYSARRTFFYWFKKRSKEIDSISYIGANKLFITVINLYKILFNESIALSFFSSKEICFRQEFIRQQPIEEIINSKKETQTKRLNSTYDSKNRYIKELERKLQESELIIEKGDKSLLDLYEVLGRISWDESYKYTPYIIDDNDKFAGVFQLATMLQYDIQEIINEKEGLLQKAQDSERVKSDFLANMSHEIRTPMNAILGFSSILLDKKDLNKESKKYLEIIERNSNHLQILINDILDFSKIESGQIKINSQNNNINQFTRTIVDSFKLPKASSDGEGNINKIEISCVLALPDSDSWAYFDEYRLGQVLRNLIQNSIKFTKEGSIKVEYIIDKSNIIFTVQDTGIGIAETKLEEIFERFKQADNSISRAYGGSGLGLSICKGLCTLMNGEIHVDSKEGVGSLFTFKIPYEKGEN